MRRVCVCITRNAKQSNAKQSNAKQSKAKQSKVSTHRHSPPPSTTHTYTRLITPHLLAPLARGGSEAAAAARRCSRRRRRRLKAAARRRRPYQQHRRRRPVVVVGGGWGWGWGLGLGSIRVYHIFGVCIYCIARSFHAASGCLVSRFDQCLDPSIDRSRSIGRTDHTPPHSIRSIPSMPPKLCLASRRGKSAVKTSL
jgi:hypothetical protein